MTPANKQSFVFLINDTTPADFTQSVSDPTLESTPSRARCAAHAARCDTPQMFQITTSNGTQRTRKARAAQLTHELPPPCQEKNLGSLIPQLKPTSSPCRCFPPAYIGLAQERVDIPTHDAGATAAARNVRDLVRRFRPTSRRFMRPKQSDPPRLSLSVIPYVISTSNYMYFDSIEVLPTDHSRQGNYIRKKRFIPVTQWKNCEISNSFSVFPR
jgi:hypothetical protein